MHAAICPVFLPLEAPWWRLRRRRPLRSGDGRMADGLLEAVRGLHLAHPELGPKPLLAKLRQQQPDLAAGNKEVREALAALKAEESKAPEAAAAARPATAAPPAAEEGGAPPNVAISLACFGCGRLPSEMGDGREKHPACEICVKLKVPTTYWLRQLPGQSGRLDEAHGVPQGGEAAAEAE